MPRGTVTPVKLVSGVSSVSLGSRSLPVPPTPAGNVVSIPRSAVVAGPARSLKVMSTVLPAITKRLLVIGSIPRVAVASIVWICALTAAITS